MTKASVIEDHGTSRPSLDPAAHALAIAIIGGAVVWAVGLAIAAWVFLA